MAITRAENQITWSAASSVSVSAGGAQLSDAGPLDVTCVAAQLHCKADNAGTPASGDVIDVYLVQTGGDPDGAGTDEFDSNGHALYLGSLDTNVEDPALKTFSIPVPQKSLKVRAVSNAATNSITFSCTVTEQRAA